MHGICSQFAENVASFSPLNVLQTWLTR